jgi:cytochrome b561/polyisoprenoid-binding protein YceI
MQARNTATTYGAVGKALHWATALLILTLLPLGFVAVEWPYDDSQALATKAWLFSLHKTLGVAVFFLALARIGWALTQPRPAPLHPDRRLETALAEGVHAALYVSLVAVPASGWVHHAAVTGFAPIWWPFGQTLPFVPQTPAVADAAASVHALFTKLLIAALALHIAGALKHHLVDRDATLRRMLPGMRVATAAPAHPRRRHALATAAGAVALYAAAGAGAVALIPEGGDRSTALAQAASLAAEADAPRAWRVEGGELTFTVAQMGSPVTGRFEGWSAAIAFDETPDETGAHGAVEVIVPISGMTIGSVTEQARGPDFFDAEAFPTSRYTARIEKAEDGSGYVARGVLALAGAEVPVDLPFTLDVVDGAATAEGQVVVDRRSFGMGERYPDEATVGFSVTIDVSLRATRVGAGADGA